MKSLLDRLCTVLDEELERQELILGLLSAQQEALCAQDRAALHARSEALAVLVRDSHHAEPRRETAFAALADLYELAPQERTLSGLIARCPEPYARRLRALQTRLREVVEATQEQNRSNARQIRRSLRAVSASLRAVRPESTPQYASYARGPAPAFAFLSAPSLVDQRG